MILNILSAIMCCSFVGANTLGSIETSQEVSFYQENKKLASYDDEEYQITLTAAELNNYSFDNFNNYCVGLGDDFYSSHLEGFEYNSVSFTIDDITIESEFLNIGLVNDDVTIYFNLNLDNKWNIQVNDEDSVFEYSLTLTLYSSFYTGVKSAIEQDIEANQSASMGDVLSDFITILVSGISTLATGIATGIVDMSKSLFLTIDSGTGAITGLSVFGGLIALFAGLALAIGITTRVYLWVTSLGKD